MNNRSTTPPLPASLPESAELIKVELHWLDGTFEELEVAACQLPMPGLLLLVTPRDGDIGVNIAALRCWRGRRSKIAVIVGAN